VGERPEEPIGHTVEFSNRDAAVEMTRAFIGLGYQDITFLAEADGDKTRGAAQQSRWRAAMNAAGLSFHRLSQHGKPPLSIEDGAAVTPRLLDRFPDTDCIFCFSYMPAFGALSALRLAGRVVPDDIGVVGFGNFEVSRFASPSISTVTADPRRIGCATGQLLAEIFAESDDAEQNPKHLPVQVQAGLRDSTKGK